MGNSYGGLPKVHCGRLKFNKSRIDRYGKDEYNKKGVSSGWNEMKDLSKHTPYSY